VDRTRDAIEDLLVCENGITCEHDENQRRAGDESRLPLVYRCGQFQRSVYPEGMIGCSRRASP
jgi:hypothetical protein